MDNHSYSELRHGQLLSMLNHLSRGDVAFASPYMAIVKTPFSNHLNTYNPKSFEPNNYKRSNIINYKWKDANIKRKEPEIVWFSISGSLWINKMFEPYKL